MFYRQCNSCGQRWAIGEVSTCKCPDETPKREWVGLNDEEKKKFVVAYFFGKYDRETAVNLMNDYEAVLKEKNGG